MLITKPLPGEFSSGHLGRLNKLNAGPYAKAYVYRMVKIAAIKQNGETPLSPVHAVASLIGMEPVQYAQHHTLLPFFGYAGRSDRAGQPSHWKIGHLKRFGFSAINPLAVLCKDCIAENTNFLGFSYWHREHQLPGSRWCTRHGSVLHYADKEDAFLYSPTEMLSHSNQYSFTHTLDNANDALRRYHQVIKLMLEQGAPESLVLMRNRLAARAKNIGLSLCMRSKSDRILSDRIVNIFPQNWLLEMFPQIEGKKSGEGTCVLDNPVRSLQAGFINAPALATALVTLFDDAESAVTYVLSNLPPTLSDTVRFKSASQQITTKKMDISPESSSVDIFKRRSRYSLVGWKNLADAYIKHAGDITSIAASLDLTIEDIRWRYSTYRKQIFTALRYTNEYTAMLTFLSGKSLFEASLKHRIPVCSIEALLRLLHRKMTLEKPLPDALH